MGKPVIHMRVDFPEQRSKLTGRVTESAWTGAKCDKWGNHTTTPDRTKVTCQKCSDLLYAEGQGR